MRFPFALIATMAVTLGMPGRTAAMALDIGRQRENGPTEWAIPHISAAHVRTEPSHGAEMSTQALMGWAIAVLERLPDGWSYVELPDGYRGYVIDNSLTFVPSDSIAYWNEAPRVIATNVLPYMACDSTGVAVSDIVQGDILIGVSCDSINTNVMLPDGRRAIIPSSMCVAVDRWERNVAFAERVLDTARSLIGIPYLWGGVTAKGMDCSGLTRLAYLSEGIMLPRDASQQALAGIEIQPEDVADGDLLFFASEKTGRINHVALYAGNDMMIESAGRVRLSAVQWAKVVSIRRVII